MAKSAAKTTSARKTVRPGAKAKSKTAGPKAASKGAVATKKTVRLASVGKKTVKTPKPAKLAKTNKTPDLLAFVEDLKRQWVSTIDALVDPLMIVGKDYVIRKANLAVAKLGGLEVKEVVGRKCYQVFAARTAPCPGCMLQENAKVENGAFELEAVRGDRFYEVTSQRMFDSAGKVDGVVHVYRDRTDAKRMHEQLAQQDKLASIGLLAGGVAHEINNPLGGILIFSQMLLRELAKDSPHYPDVVEIEAATQRCKAIVESLLDFARQQPARSKLGRQVDLDPVEAIRTAVRFGRVSIQRGGEVEMVEDFQGKHQILADRNRIIQLFLNLIQNAVQAMPDGGTLWVRARTKMGAKGTMTGVYEVEDTGVGIPPEYLKKIFDPFFTTKDPGEGTGLGLALCYGIVQEMGGTMGVESTVNVGTRFTVELPLAAAAASRPAS